MTVIEDYMSVDERDDLDFDLLAPGALGMAGMHGVFRNQGVELATDALTH
jgi:hypothetical protein